MKIKEKFYKTVTHFFPDFNQWIKWIIKDPRHSSYIKYDIKGFNLDGLIFIFIEVGFKTTNKFQV